MKKIILLAFLIMSVDIMYGQTATSANQTIQITKTDTSNARLNLVRRNTQGTPSYGGTATLFEITEYIRQNTLGSTSGLGIANYNEQVMKPKADTTVQNLRKIMNVLTSSVVSVATSSTTSYALTLSTPTAAVSSGTVATGAKAITFITSSNFAGTINTATFSGNLNISFRPIASYTYPAIPYTVTSGTLIILPTR